MPHITQVGRKAWSFRLLATGLYLLLSLGAITMAYPFMLMLTMATAGRSEYQEFRLIQQYWHSEAAQFRRYVIDLLPFYHAAWRPQDDVFVARLSPWFGQDHWFLGQDIKVDDVTAP